MPDQIKHGPNKHDNSEDWRSAMFATPDVDLRASPDGSLYLTSRRILSARVRTVVDWLEQWAHDTPAAVFISEVMSSGQRQGLSYAKAWHDSGRLGAGLLAIGLKPGDRLAVFAPNGIRHMRIALGALRAGIIYVPIAAQYAALGGDKEKLASVLEKLKPAAVYCDSFADAPLAARAARLVIEGDAGLAQLFEAADGVDDPDIAWLDPSAPAKLLLTSGSTGQPKPVPYSHAMMTDNLLATLDVWPFVLRRKPVLVDWLPWNHAFGGNNNVHLVLSQGGTLHIDESRGKPERFDLHVQNLRRLQPTFHGAVPSGWAALLPVMEADDEFRQAFFGNLDAMFSAGAAMAPDIFTRLCRNSAAVRGLPVPILTGWGATETGPGATLVHAPNAEPGWIGTPLPGAEIRLSPSGDKFELSVRGPSVMRGYWGASASAAVDEEGFYRTGDAGRLVDPERPELGLRFEGRLAEDFKLENGSWVNASGLRHELLRRADGALHDVVILGADQAYIAALCWAARPIALDDLFAQHNAEHSSPTKRIERFATLSPAPSASELTPKGEVDRNALRKNRPFEIEALFNVRGQA
ncbi:AMP-binding protein [Pseudomonas sp. PDM32]|uniref:AMP-binding protein n=1 Tax=Pseudomonas sp. PDM32 TaxID=2854768 RepID=UPI001C487135|nr:AMP-binding protein [Pseudomonas sp. PDM32]MBV7573278.1 AMP-binding protein [Pseudomonas sp. PDM32]